MCYVVKNWIEYLVYRGRASDRHARMLPNQWQNTECSALSTSAHSQPQHTAVHPDKLHRSGTNATTTTTSTSV